MKRTILLLLLCISFVTAYPQAPFVQWQKSIGGSGVDAASAIQKTTDSGYFFISLSGSADGDFNQNYGMGDAWLVKLTPWGDITWKKNIGGSGDDEPFAEQQTTDGGYIIASGSNSNDHDVTGNHGGYDYWIVKVDDTGKIQWQRSYGGSTYEFPMAVQQTTDGGYIVAGWTQSTDGDIPLNHGGRDYWVLKLNDTGGIQWNKTYGGTDDDICTSIIQTSDGGYIIAGNSGSTDGDVTGNHGSDDIWLVKITSAGAITWQKSLGGSGNDDDGDEAYPGCIQQTFDHGYIIMGETQSNDGDVSGNHGGLFDYWVAKLDSNGTIVWQNCFGSSGDDDGYFVQQTADSGYIVTGTSNTADGNVTSIYGGYDYWVLRLSPSGSLLWQKNYGGTQSEYGFCVRATSDSEFIVCGYSGSNDIDVSGNHGGDDAWIVKLAYCYLPAVSPITGDTIVCGGSAISLSDNTPGGTWSTNNGNATLSGGTATGVYAGSVAIFYSVTNSCGTGGATKIISVDHPDPVIVASGDTLRTTLTYTTYQWIKNGTAVPGATNAKYVGAVATYSVTVTDAIGCTSTSSAYMIHSLGLSTTYNNTSYSIMPNPTIGNIYIKGASDVNIKIYNIVGQLMKEAKNTDNISIAELPPAMYFVRLFDQQGRFIWQGKVLKE